MTDAKKTFRELRVDADFLNRCCENEGLPQPIPNYSLMRKAELGKRLTHYEADTDAYLAEYGFLAQENK